MSVLCHCFQLKLLKIFVDDHNKYFLFMWDRNGHNRQCEFNSRHAYQPKTLIRKHRCSQVICNLHHFSLIFLIFFLHSMVKTYSIAKTERLLTLINLMISYLHVCRCRFLCFFQYRHTYKHDSTCRLLYIFKIAILSYRHGCPCRWHVSLEIAIYTYRYGCLSRLLRICENRHKYSQT